VITAGHVIERIPSGHCFFARQQEEYDVPRFSSARVDKGEINLQTKELDNISLSLFGCKAAASMLHQFPVEFGSHYEDAVTWVTVDDCINSTNINSRNIGIGDAAVVGFESGPLLVMIKVT
jgi:hypothetical protein